MKKCVTVWNYEGDPVENAYKFHKIGFEAVSWLGSVFQRYDEEEDARLAAMLKETGLQFTVHSRLPNPDDQEDCALFRQELEHGVNWQRKYGLLYSYTFDFWYDRERLMPYLEQALCEFRGMGTVLACEDNPLDMKQMEIFDKVLRPGDQFGILLDAGHMNIRQHTDCRINYRDFVEAIDYIPMPIIEVHLHDNKGQKDDHMYLGYGNLPLDAVVEGLKKHGFDGFVTVEIIRRQWSEEQAFQYAVDSRDQFLRLWNA